jgi:hypothetical protein
MNRGVTWKPQTPLTPTQAQNRNIKVGITVNSYDSLTGDSVSENEK